MIAYLNKANPVPAKGDLDDGLERILVLLLRRGQVLLIPLVVHRGIAKARINNHFES